jgi:hypothetical protein
MPDFMQNYRLQIQRYFKHKNELEIWSQSEGCCIRSGKKYGFQQKLQISQSAGFLNVNFLFFPT